MAPAWGPFTLPHCIKTHQDHLREKKIPYCLYQLFWHQTFQDSRRPKPWFLNTSNYSLHDYPLVGQRFPSFSQGVFSSHCQKTNPKKQLCFPITIYHLWFPLLYPSLSNPAQQAETQCQIINRPPLISKPALPGDQHTLRGWLDSGTRAKVSWGRLRTLVIKGGGHHLSPFPSLSFSIPQGLCLEFISSFFFA